VEVEYLPDRPTVNRIQGLRVNVVGMFTLFVLIFPALGLIFLIYAVARVSGQGRKNLRLLAEGDLAVGRVENLTRTLTQINRQYVYKITVGLRRAECIRRPIEPTARKWSAPRLGKKTKPHPCAL